jgi:hypothetical protein
MGISEQILSHARFDDSDKIQGRKTDREEDRKDNPVGLVST